MRRTVRTKHTEKADRPEPGLCVKIDPCSLNLCTKASLQTYRGDIDYFKFEGNK